MVQAEVRRRHHVDLSEEEAQEQLTRRLARLEARSEEIAEPVLSQFASLRELHVSNHLRLRNGV